MELFCGKISMLTLVCPVFIDATIWENEDQVICLFFSFLSFLSFFCQPKSTELIYNHATLCNIKCISLYIKSIYTFFEKIKKTKDFSFHGNFLSTNNSQFKSLNIRKIDLNFVKYDRIVCNVWSIASAIFQNKRKWAYTTFEINGSYTFLSNTRGTLSMFPRELIDNNSLSRNIALCRKVSKIAIHIHVR